MAAPLHQKPAVPVELDDAGVAFAGLVSVGHENGAVRRDHDGIGLMERIRPAAGNPRPPQGPQQPPGAVEFQDVIADAMPDVAVGDPDVVLRIDEEAVREKQFARAEGLHVAPMLVEFHDGIDVAALAAVGAAAFGNPDVALVVDRHRAGGAHVAALREAEEVIVPLVRIGQRGGPAVRRLGTERVGRPGQASAGEQSGAGAPQVTDVGAAHSRCTRRSSCRR